MLYDECLSVGMNNRLRETIWNLMKQEKIIVYVHIARR